MEACGPKLRKDKNQNKETSGEKTKIEGVAIAKKGAWPTKRGRLGGEKRRGVNTAK